MKQTAKKNTKEKKVKRTDKTKRDCAKKGKGEVIKENTINEKSENPPFSKGGKGEFSEDIKESIEDIKEDKAEESQDEQEEEKRLELLTFILGNEEYAIDVMMIKEIIRAIELTYIPKTPAYIRGIISLRGVVIPIFDLRNILKLYINDLQTIEKSREEEGHYVIININEKLIGIIVDSVKEVVEIKETKIESPPQVVRDVEKSHLKGVTRYKGRLLILIDIERMLNIENENDLY
ncbi:MAG: chemotaxis protein CheW [Nitrospirota bacterium]